MRFGNFGAMGVMSEYTASSPWMFQTFSGFGIGTSKSRFAQV